jgi:hypothetical protein
VIEIKSDSNVMRVGDDYTPKSWTFYLQRRYAIEIQKFIVPWCIAQYGLAYPKKLTLKTVKEMLIAICDDQGLLQGFP